MLFTCMSGFVFPVCVCFGLGISLVRGSFRWLPLSAEQFWSAFRGCVVKLWCFGRALLHLHCLGRLCCSTMKFVSRDYRPAMASTSSPRLELFGTGTCVTEAIHNPRPMGSKQCTGKFARKARKEAPSSNCFRGGLCSL